MVRPSALTKLGLSTVAALLLFGVAGAADSQKSLDIVVQGTTQAVVQDPSGIRDSSWSGTHRIPSCSVEGYRNTATGTPMTHIVVSGCRTGDYIIEAVSVGRALGLTVMAEGPGWGCGRGDGIKAPATGEIRSWKISFASGSDAECRVVLQRLEQKARGR